jgi:hypothetical protein
VSHEIARQSGTTAWSSPATTVRSGFGVTDRKASSRWPATIRSKYRTDAAGVVADLTGPDRKYARAGYESRGPEGGEPDERRGKPAGRSGDTVGSYGRVDHAIRSGGVDRVSHRPAAARLQDLGARASRGWTRASAADGYPVPR